MLNRVFITVQPSALAIWSPKHYGLKTFFSRDVAYSDSSNCNQGPKYNLLAAS